jgi:hypothetical protein
VPRRKMRVMILCWLVTATTAVDERSRGTHAHITR